MNTMTSKHNEIKENTEKLKVKVVLDCHNTIPGAWLFKRFGLLNFKFGHELVKLLLGDRLGFMLVSRSAVSSCQLHALVEKYKTIRLIQ